MAKTSKPAPKKQAAKSANGEASDGAGPDDEAAAAPAASSAPEIQAPPPQPGAQPSMRILGQYLKDLSFENPHAPQSLAPQKAQPEINISINVNARNLAPTDFEVELHIDAKATSESKIIFAAEILYAGVFRLENFPQNMLHPAVLIECPRMLFPFARQILGEATRNGGFPPLMLDPIDFATMYQKRMAAQAQVTA
ncbi:MAG: protein-export chaperone SecB [Parvibaculaceae bacterium]